MNVVPFTIDRIDELVEYITTPPYHNITQAAEHFHTSRPTINTALKELSDEQSLYYNEWKAKRVKTVLDELLKIARSRAGSKSKRKVIINHELALALRYANIYGGATLRDLGTMVGCSHMTVSNAISALSETDILDQDAQELHDRAEIAKEQRDIIEAWLDEKGLDKKRLEESWKSR